MATDAENGGSSVEAIYKALLLQNPKKRGWSRLWEQATEMYFVQQQRTPRHKQTGPKDYEEITLSRDAKLRVLDHEGEEKNGTNRAIKREGITNDGVRVKRVRVKEPRPRQKEEDKEFERVQQEPEPVCGVCGKLSDPERTLLCDGKRSDGKWCDNACHTFCCDPPYFRLPRGKWYCHECREENKKPRRKRSKMREETEGASGSNDKQGGENSSSEGGEGDPNIVCGVCGVLSDPGRTLLCDGVKPDGTYCENACHTFCCTPPLRRLPKGEWYCKDCLLQGQRPRRRRRDDSAPGTRCMTCGLLEGVGCLCVVDYVDERCDVCGLSNDEDFMLLCDGRLSGKWGKKECPGAQHTFCCSPPLSAIPAGKWFCNSCTAKKAKRGPRTKLKPSESDSDCSLSNDDEEERAKTFFVATDVPCTIPAPGSVDTQSLAMYKGFRSKQLSSLNRHRAAARRVYLRALESSLAILASREDNLDVKGTRISNRARRAVAPKTELQDPSLVREDNTLLGNDNVVGKTSLREFWQLALQSGKTKPGESGYESDSEPRLRDNEPTELGDLKTHLQRFGGAGQAMGHAHKNQNYDDRNNNEDNKENERNNNGENKNNHDRRSRRSSGSGDSSVSEGAEVSDSEPGKVDSLSLLPVCRPSVNSAHAKMGSADAAPRKSRRVRKIITGYTPQHRKPLPLPPTGGEIKMAGVRDSKNCDYLNHEALQLVPQGRAKCVYCGAICEAFRGIKVHFASCAARHSRSLREIFPGRWPRTCWVWWEAYGKWYKGKATPLEDEDPLNPCWDVLYEGTAEEEVEMAHVVSFQDPASFLGTDVSTSSSTTKLIQTNTVRPNKGDSTQKLFHKLFIPLKLPTPPSSVFPLVISPPVLPTPLPRREAYLVASPDYVTGQLRPHQISGINFLIHQFDHSIGCILADEMGLGKTLQALTFLAYLKNERNLLGPHLLLMPAALIHHWEREINRWLPNVFACVTIQGSALERKEVLNRPEAIHANVDIVIASLESFVQEEDYFKSLRWLTVCIDEAHRLPGVALELIHELKSNFQFAITGSPSQNLGELLTLLHIVLPEVNPEISTESLTPQPPHHPRSLSQPSVSFPSYPKVSPRLPFSPQLQSKVVREGLCGARTTHSIPVPKSLKRDSSCSVLRAIRELVQVLMARRTKQMTEPKLNSKIDVTLFVPMTRLQQLWHWRLLASELSNVTHLSSNHMTNIITQLRKVCNHPATLTATRLKDVENHFNTLRQARTVPTNFSGARGRSSWEQAQFDKVEKVLAVALEGHLPAHPPSLSSLSLASPSFLPSFSTASSSCPSSSSCPVAATSRSSSLCPSTPPCFCSSSSATLSSSASSALSSSSSCSQRLASSFVPNSHSTQNSQPLDIPIRDQLRYWQLLELWQADVASLLETSGKLKVCDQLLTKLHQQHKRVIVFCHFSRMLDLLELYLTAKDWTYQRLDEKTKPVIRELGLQFFDQNNTFVYLIASRAAQGFSIPAIDSVILYDADFDFVADLRAQERAQGFDRIRPLEVYRLVTEGSVEESILDRAVLHGTWDRRNAGGEKDALGTEKLTMKETWKILRKAACAANKARSDLDPLSLEQLLAYSEERMSDMARRGRKKLGGARTEAEADEEEDDFGIPCGRFFIDKESLLPPVLRNKYNTQGEDQFKLSLRLAEKARKLQGGGVRAKPTNTTEALVPIEPLEERFKPAQRSVIVIVSETVCFVCRKTGVTASCGLCPRAYHLICIGTFIERRLAREGQLPTTGLSIDKCVCPWHECRQCGKSRPQAGGVLLCCMECPTAYCFSHWPPGSRCILPPQQYLTALTQRGYDPLDSVSWFLCEHCQN